MANMQRVPVSQANETSPILVGFSEYIQARPGILISSLLKGASIFNPVFKFSRFFNLKGGAEQTLELTPVLKYNVGSPQEARQKAAYGTGEGMSSMSGIPIKIENRQATLIFRFDNYKLLKTINEKMMPAGSDNEVAYAAAIQELIGAAVQFENNAIAFLGDTTQSPNDGNLFFLDGFLKQIKEATGDDAAIKTGSAPVKYTAANAVAKINELIDKYNDTFPKLVKADRCICLPTVDFYTAVRAFQGLYGVATKENFTENAESKYTYKIPGTNVTLYSMDGLDGVHEHFMCRPQILCPSTDEEDELQKVELVKDEITKFYFINMTFKLGAKVALTKEVVYEAV